MIGLVRGNYHLLTSLKVNQLRLKTWKSRGHLMCEMLVVARNFESPSGAEVAHGLGDLEIDFFEEAGLADAVG